MSATDDNHTSYFENKENVPIVKGDYQTKSGDIYEGELLDGVPNGRGKITSKEGITYEGEFEKGMPHGQGKTFDSEGIIHEGQYMNGKPNGVGVQHYKNGTYYEGYFENGKFSGEGEIVHKDGSRYKGKFKDNVPANPSQTKKNQKVLLIDIDNASVNLSSLKQRYNSVEHFNESSIINATYLRNAITQSTKGDKNNKLKIVIGAIGNIHGEVQNQGFYINTLERILKETKSYNSNIKRDHADNEKDLLNNIDIVLNAGYASNVVAKNKKLQEVLKAFVKAGIDVRVSAGAGEVSASSIITNGKNVLPLSEGNRSYVINEFNFKTLDDFNDISPSAIKEYKTEDDFMKDEYVGKKKPIGIMGCLQNIIAFAMTRNKNNVSTVKGEQHYTNGDIYKGELMDGVPNGRGKITSKEGITYEGEFENGIPHGQGKTFDSKGIIHEGQYMNGAPNGLGVQHYKNGTYYEGYFENGKHNGEGEIVHNDGSRYKGKFKNDVPAIPLQTKKNQKVLLIDMDNDSVNLSSLKQRYNSVEHFDESSIMNATYLRNVITQSTKGDKNKKLKIIIGTHGNINGGLQNQRFYINTLERILKETKSYNSTIKSDHANNQKDLINNIDIVLNVCYASNVVTKNKKLQKALKAFVKAGIDVRVSASNGEFAASRIITNGKNVLPLSKGNRSYDIKEFNFIEVSR